MCGFLCLRWNDNAAIRTFESAIEKQRHRGPDETRYISSSPNHLYLGANRLAIIDRENGSQPFQNSEKTVSLTFNGEIFNALELRRNLESQGDSFISNYSDTEVILRGYLREGINFVEKLNGMFSILILDERIGKVIGIRDRFGIKPFHYYKKDNVFVCGSELEPIIDCIKASGKTLTISNESIVEYLQVGFVSTPNTIYNEIKVLEPGKHLEIDLNDMSLSTSIWCHAKYEKWLNVTNSELPILIKQDFLRAVESWSSSDFPLALSLSGGLDSTCILLALRILKIDVKTFSLIFRKAHLTNWDESINISNIVRESMLNHNFIELSAEHFLDSIPGLVKSLGQPYAGGLPSFRIFEEISHSHRVCLTGTGGDEIFGNYGRHKIIDSSRISNQSQFDEMYSRLIFKSKTQILKRIFPDLDFTKQINDWFQHLEIIKSPDAREKLEHMNIKTQLSDEFLFMTDRLSMRYSLEARTPYLDHKFVENVLSISPKYRYSGPYKGLLIRAFEKELKELNLSQEKRGFSLPLSIWLRNEMQSWAEQLMDEVTPNQFVLVDTSALKEVYHDFKSGNDENILIIWRILMLIQWIKILA